MKRYADLLAEASTRVREIPPWVLRDRLAADPAPLLLDVREPDEYDQGALPNAVHIPRGHLEAQVEGRLTDKHGTVVVYCAVFVKWCNAPHVVVTVPLVPVIDTVAWSVATIAVATLDVVFDVNTIVAIPEPSVLL